MTQLQIVKPEVKIVRNQVLTSSLNIAEYFEKRHKDVLKAISKLGCSDEFKRRNFAPHKYKDDRGNNQPMYLMTKSGFSFLVMGFTGQKADRFKEDFINAFDAMEEALQRQKMGDWKELRSEGKEIRRELTDVLQDFVNYSTSQGSKNAIRYYKNITNMTYKCLGLIDGNTVPNGLRDLLDNYSLRTLSMAEIVAEQAIRKGMMQGMYYKDIFIYAKERVMAFAESVPSCLEMKQKAPTILLEAC